MRSLRHVKRPKLGLIASGRSRRRRCVVRVGIGGAAAAAVYSAMMIAVDGRRADREVRRGGERHTRGVERRAERPKIVGLADAVRSGERVARAVRRTPPTFAIAGTQFKRSNATR